VTGSQHSFPDTSNTRFGTHLEAASDVIVNLEFHRTFMQFIHNSKSTVGFNNMEQNIDLGLKCPSTLTKLEAASLYCEFVDQPYMAGVREAEKNGDNLLDLGPLHAKVINYCLSVADDPDIVLRPVSTSCEPANYPTTIFGEPPKRIAVLQAVYARAGELPHLKAMVSAFFRGAHSKWVTFSAEFEANGKIAKMTPEQRKSAFLHPTNDRNEGALGLLRITLRRSPNVSLRGYNARMLLKANRVDEWLRSKPPGWRVFLRKKAREWNREHNERQRRLHMAEHKANAARENAVKAREKARKIVEQRARDDAEMATVKVELDLAKIALMNGKQLMLQLKWHHRRGVKDAKGTNTAAGHAKLRVDEKKELLRTLIAVYDPEHNKNRAPGSGVSLASP
jgi:hypothetical protein